MTDNAGFKDSLDTHLTFYCKSEIKTKNAIHTIKNAVIFSLDYMIYKNVPISDKQGRRRTVY